MRRLTLLTIIAISCSFSSLIAQDVLMQGWYWEFPKSPTTSTNWAVTLDNKAEELAEAGFTHVWLPPLSRGSFGGYSNGYDVKDLFDLGEFGLGATGFGTRSEIDVLISSFDTYGIDAVADVIYNHRDGGKWENNPAVEGWIENFSWTQAANSESPYPSDRWRSVLPVGGSTGNGAGDYYFKISSASQHPNFHGAGYDIFMYTNRVQNAGMPFQNEVEPNGGGDCAQVFNDISLGRLMKANIDDAGCTVDEFHLDLAATDFFAAGDTIFIELRNTGGYSDHRIYGLWNGALGMDIQPQIKYQTHTDFTSMPSGRGDMNWSNFKPNGSPTTLAGDQDYMWFFYDYDNYNPATRDTLQAFSEWLWEDVGVRGLRLDAVKHFPTDFLGNLLSNMHNKGYNPGIVVGEFFDYNAYVLNGWTNSVASSMSSGAQAAIDVRAFDFSLRGALKEACDNGFYDVRNVFQSGMVDGAGGSPFDAVTFVNNHDFRDPGAAVQSGPMLAYTYILTNNHIGLPSVYYPDYYGVARPNAPTANLENRIMELISIQKNFVAGSTVLDKLNKFGSVYSASYSSGNASKTLLYQMGNNPSGTSTVVAINFDSAPLSLTHSINTGIGVAPGDTLWALAGGAASNFMVVSGSSQINIEIPARGYAVWVNCQFTPEPKNPVSQNWCPTDPIPALSVDDEGFEYNWYLSETSSTLVASNTATFTPSFEGTYWVEAVGACGTSGRVSATLTSDLSACNCSTPGSPDETVNASNSVTVSWDVAGDAVGYQINGRKAGTSSWKNLNRASNVNTINVLSPATDYEWRVRSFCGGSDFSDWTAIRNFSTPAARLVQQTVELFPNPATTSVSITGDLNGAEISLTDMLGRVIQTRKSTDNQNQFDLSELESGIYQFLIRKDETVIVKPLEIIR